MATAHRMDLLLAKEDPSEGRKVLCQTEREAPTWKSLFCVAPYHLFEAEKTCDGNFCYP